MNISEAALIISGVSIGISLSSLAWNIYKDIFLKPRSKMLGNVSFIIQGDTESENYLNIQLTNLGPGKIIINNIVLKQGGFLKMLFGKQKTGIIMYDYENPLNPKLPMTIEQYNSAAQLLLMRKAEIFNFPVNRLGFVDNLGRYHWIKKRQLNEIRKSYRRMQNDPSKPDVTE